MTTTILSKDATEAVVQQINHRRFNTSMDTIRIIPRILDETIRLEMQAEGRSMVMGDFPERTILKLYGLTRKFLNSCETDLDLATKALEKTRAMAVTEAPSLSISTTGDNQVASIIVRKKAEDEFMSLSDAWNALKDEPDVAGSAEVVDLGSGKFDLRLVTAQTFSPVRTVGDVVHVGVRVHVNSSVTVNPFAYRLVCANGMQRMEEGDFSVVDMNDPIVSLRKGFDDALKLSRRFTQEFTLADEIVVPNPHEYVMRALKIAGSTDRLRSAVQDGINEFAPRGTLYELLNIVTAIARGHAADKPKIRNKIEALAGRVLAMQTNGQCPKCSSRV